MSESGTVSYVKWTSEGGDALSQPLLERVCWPQVKSIKRVLEKLMRVYGQDVSKLLDVARCCIFFGMFLY